MKMENSWAEMSAQRNLIAAQTTLNARINHRAKERTNHAKKVIDLLEGIKIKRVCFGRPFFVCHGNI
jgi:hypothetical protein